MTVNGYTLKRCDHPIDDPRGGICVYHKECLPLRSMPRMTTISQTLAGINVFVTALYRSPSVEKNTADVINCFISNLQYPMENIDK